MREFNSMSNEYEYNARTETSEQLRSIVVFPAMERQTLKKPQKSDKFPPCPLNNPYSEVNSYVMHCTPGTLLSRDVSHFEI